MAFCDKLNNSANIHQVTVGKGLYTTRSKKVEMFQSISVE